MSALNKFNRPLQIAGAVTALFGIPIVTGTMLGTGTGSYIIMAVMFGSLLTFGGVFWLCYRFWRRKKGNALSNALRKDGSSRNLDGIESIRSNFEEGMEKMRRAGKNVYDLPWFLLAGQTGAGKTEAIRRSHSKEDFPPGLNDLMQGVGGTLNMNWWFTNKAIILDTAGRIFEEKVVAGQGNEWLEFLKMLRRARKNMPINGFILAIPADSLICDDISSIEQKASHIAAQLTLVQDTLGVRFPVFVIVTKTDFIPGFREFVENVSEPRLQQQMLGWSNPQSLDEPFSPENIDNYLDGVVEKLKKRRLTYMLDPRPHGKKRLDELDSLFAFPNQLRDIVPSLRRYLEIVFALNPWSQKPLFIRGIYFTSSLQQGEALDEALASVLGKDLGQMALSSFKKETPLFLRDTFFSKIYREYGLVTSARKVGAAMRRRTALFALVSLLALFGVLGAAWFGARSFQEQVGDEYAHWRHAAAELEGGEDRSLALRWRQPIVFDTGTGAHFTSNREHTFDVGGSSTTLPAYLVRLGDFAESDLTVPAVFKPLRFFDEVFTGDRFDRPSAFRNVFEASVVFPVLENAREKLRMTDPSDWDERSAAGLRSMVRMQMLLNRPDRAPGYSAAFFRELDRLHHFVVAEPLGPEIEQVYGRFFGDSFLAASGWPSARHAPLYAPAESLDDPRLAAVSRGLDLWARNTENVVDMFTDDMRAAGDLLGEFEALGRDEALLAREGGRTGTFPAAELEGLESRFARHSSGFVPLADFGGDPFSFERHFRARLEAARADLDARTATISEEIATFGTGSEDPVAGEILSRLTSRRDALRDDLDAVVEPAWVGRMQAVDRDLLGSAGFNARMRLYRSVTTQLQVLAALTLTARASAEEPVQAAEEAHAAIQSLLGDYRGHLEGDLESLRPLADERLAAARDRFAESFFRLGRDELGQRLGFPVLRDGERMLRPADIGTLGTLARNLDSEARAFAERVTLPGHPGLVSLAADSAKVDAFIRDHLPEAALRRPVRLVKPSLADSLNRLGRERGLGPDAMLPQSIYWRARLVHAGDASPRRIGRNPLPLGEIPLDANRLNISFTSVIDGSPGDSGGFILSGDWVPIRLLFGSGVQRDTATPGLYRVHSEARTPDGRELPFIFLLEVPESLPAPEEWLSRRNLENF